MRGRGLKHQPVENGAEQLWSPPMRGRGLKPAVPVVPGITLASPPMRGRGLKPISAKELYRDFGRPPCGGVD